MFAKSNFRSPVRRLVADQSGVSTIQYGVVLALIALGSISALQSLGGEAKKSINNTGAKVAANRPNADPFAGGLGAVEPAPSAVPPNSTTTKNVNPNGGAIEPATAASTVASPINGGAYEPAMSKSAPLN